MGRVELKISYSFFIISINLHFQHCCLLAAASTSAFHSTCTATTVSGIFFIFRITFIPKVPAWIVSTLHIRNTLHGEKEAKKKKQKAKMIITITPSQMAWKASRKNYGFYNAFISFSFNLECAGAGGKHFPLKQIVNFRKAIPIKNQLISKLKVAPFKYTQFVSLSFWTLSGGENIQWRKKKREVDRKEKRTKNINFIYLPLGLSSSAAASLCCRYNHVPPTLIEHPARFSLHRPASYLSISNACVHITNSNGSVSRLPFWNIYPKQKRKKRKYYSSME